MSIILTIQAVVILYLVLAGLNLRARLKYLEAERDRINSHLVQQRQRTNEIEIAVDKLA